jgi:hypothetical protein
LSVSPSSGTDVTVNDWHHIAVSADRNGNASFYVDGDLDEAVDIYSKSSYSISFTNVYIGSYLPDNPSRDFDGIIDDVRIYDEA